VGRRKKKSAAKGAAPAATHLHYDADSVRSYARGQWAGILSSLGGIPSHLLDGSHHPCPKSGCAARTDGFRFTNQDDGGSIICNQCCRHEAGNGLLALVWFTGLKFYDCVVMVAEHLGVPPSNSHAGHKSNGKHNADPAENLKFQDWTEQSEMLAMIWTTHKKPITLAAIKICCGRLARYRDKFTVIALPVWGEKLTVSSPVGWTLYNVSGGVLPSYSKDKQGNWVESNEKILTTFGSKAGFIGPVDQLATATEIWKLEGPSDLLAFYSLDNRPSHVAAVTNSHGAGEKPLKWMIETFAGKSAMVLHDADKPGQRGAVGYRDDRRKWHRGWCGYLHGTAAQVSNVSLPYDVEDTHGKDLRDFLAESEAQNATA
jgi:hypothetical protein